MVSITRLTRVLITGASGFVGPVVARLLAESTGCEVVGLASTSPAGADRDPFRGFISQDLVTEPLVSGDFDAVLHLAGLSQVGPSFQYPQRYITAHSGMMINVCEPLLAQGSRARIVAVSSGSVYGASTGSPLNEQSPLSFDSPYAVSKGVMESLGAYYRARGLDIVIARPFNHVGAGQREGFIVPDLVAKVRMLGVDEQLQAGNLDARRDYTDVRDVAAAYAALLSSDSLDHVVYNIASGRSYSGWDVLALAASALGVDTPTAVPTTSRALDPTTVVGDASRLTRETGWRPRYSLRESIVHYVEASS